jgi:tight adherence protein C
MTASATGAVLGAILATGLLLVATSWRRARRPTPRVRVDPYLGDLVTRPAPTGSTVGAVYGPLLRSAGEAVGRVTGGASGVERRLTRLGNPYGVEELRMQQLVWGALGFGVAAVLSTIVWTTYGGSATVLLVVCLVGLVAGVLGRDTYLTTQVRRHERRLAEEFPVVADLLALAVAAGESPVAGLERVLRVLRGALADELATVLSDVRTGRTVPAAFDALAARTGVPSIARFAEGLAVAVDRGTPLVDVLHAQAADVREAARRELVEAGGRKEILMMVPVVFLVLPVTVVFAFYPGLVGLRLSS